MAHAENKTKLTSLVHHSPQQPVPSPILVLTLYMYIQNSGSTGHELYRYTCTCKQCMYMYMEKRCAHVHVYTIYMYVHMYMLYVDFQFKLISTRPGTCVKNYFMVPATRSVHVYVNSRQCVYTCTLYTHNKSVY